MANETGNTPKLADVAVVQMNETIRYADRLKEIMAATNEVGPALSWDSLARTVGTKLDIPSSAVQSIFSALDNLDSLKGDNEDSVDGAIDSVVRTFGEDKFPGLSEVRTKIREAVESLTEDSALTISLKARRLSYFYEKLFIDAEIITDARPVYNTKGDAVLEYVINHCLVVSYHEDAGYGSAHRHPRLHIGLDIDDIFTLRDACDRAILKSTTLKNALGKTARVLGSDG